ncbi:MAG: hypothetical protein V4696_09550 [Pseudomonadota bacterium]
MRDNLVSAVFDDRTDAELAVRRLREAGISDSQISIIAQNEGHDTVTTDGAGEEVAKDVIGTAALGAGVGTLLGIAALAIPGVGPLVAAGAIASTAIPGAAVTGAAIGAAAGGVSGLLKDHGISDDDAAYYEQSINDGGIFVSVDAEGASLDRRAAEGILYSAGGHSSSRARSEVTTH